MTKTILIASMVLSTVLLGGLIVDDAFAAVDMFIKVGDIKGESKDERHQEQIDVLAWSWGISQAGVGHIGSGGGSGKVNVQDLSFTKFVDSSTSELMLNCCRADKFDTVVLDVCRATEPDGRAGLCYFTMTMEKVTITSVSTGGSGGEDRLTENVTLNFDKVEFKYTPHDPETGKPTGVPPQTWSIGDKKKA